MPLIVFFLFTLGITGARLKWAIIGWVEPTEFNSLFTFRAIYFPGDIGFDFLELKPTDWKCFSNTNTMDLKYWLSNTWKYWYNYTRVDHPQDNIENDYISPKGI